MERVDTKDLLSVAVFFFLGMFLLSPLYLKTPHPVGYVEGNSMYPAYKEGDLVIIYGKEVENIELREVIVFRPPDDDPDFVIHRVIAIKENSGDLYFKTKGDNVPHDDTEKWGWIPEENIVGVVIFRIPYLGYPFIVFPLLFLRIVIGFLTVIILLSMVKDFVNRREKRETENYGEENLS